MKTRLATFSIVLIACILASIAILRTVQAGRLRQATSEAAALCMEYTKLSHCPALGAVAMSLDPWGREYVCDRDGEGSISIKSLGDVAWFGTIPPVACRFERNFGSNGSCLCEMLAR